MAHKQTAVIGDPIDHSLSPKIHNHWIESEKIDVGAYQKINVKNDDGPNPIDDSTDEIAVLLRKHGSNTKKELRAFI